MRIGRMFDRKNRQKQSRVDAVADTRTSLTNPFGQER